MTEAPAVNRVHKVDGEDEVLSPTVFGRLLKQLLADPHSFPRSSLALAFEHIAQSETATTPAQVGAFLAALRVSKLDHDPAVVAQCAEVLRRHSKSVDVGQHGEGPVCDIVGTGGDGHNTFNVSTTAAIVTAGAGCRVYKHGNKAATSSSGSADILMSLGCPLTQLSPSSISQIAPHSPFLFLFAPMYHPSLAPLAPIRKSLGFPTIFNAIGPLINPARPKAMILGVYHKSLGPIFAEALKLTAVDRAWVVCGDEGLDEISIAGPTHVWDLNNGSVTNFTVDPSHFGLESHPLTAVVGSTPEANAAKLTSLLNGELPTSDPIENFVVMNAGALIMLSGKATDLVHGVSLARESIKSGSAANALESFRRTSSEEVEKTKQ